MRDLPADIDDVSRTLGRIEDMQLTKRERIAAMCLQGILADPNDGFTEDFDDKVRARVDAAIEHADALLQALEGK